MVKVAQVVSTFPVALRRGIAASVINMEKQAQGGLGPAGIGAGLGGLAGGLYGGLGEEGSLAKALLYGAGGAGLGAAGGAGLGALAAPDVSPAAQAVMAREQEQPAPGVMSGEALKQLVQIGQATGMTPQQMAELAGVPLEAMPPTAAPTAGL